MNSIKINYLNLIFKVGKDGTLYFLYCKKISCRLSSQKTNIPDNNFSSEVIEKVPDFINSQFKSKITREVFIREKDQLCYKCKKKKSKIVLY